MQGEVEDLTAALASERAARTPPEQHLTHRKTRTQRQETAREPEVRGSWDVDRRESRTVGGVVVMLGLLLCVVAGVVAFSFRGHLSNLIVQMRL